MAESIFMQAMEAIKTAIDLLALDDLPSHRVKVRRLEHDGEKHFEGITIHPVPEIFHHGTNMRESVGYGCAVTMVVNNNNNSLYLLDRLLLWREKIRRHFVENTTLSTMSTICTIKVEMGHVIEWKELYDRNIDVSRLVLRVYSWETRT